MSCDLTKYDFDVLYSSPQEIKSFYSNALNDAKIYKRLSAYFSNDVFEYLLPGIPEFIKNDGYFQLVLSKEIDKKTVVEIEKGYLLREKQEFDLLTNKELVDFLGKLASSKYISLFSFLIAIGKLDIKIAFKEKGIVHHKVGIITDGKHNLTYIGSTNFTDNGIAVNDESFEVTIDWDEPSKRELKTIKDANILFNSFWENTRENVITVSLPDPYISKLIKSIDFEEVKKYTKKINFIRLGITKQKNIEIYSNIDLGLFFKDFRLSIYSKFLVKKENTFYLEKVEKVSELFNFSEKIKKICQENNYGFYLTYQLSNFFELRVRDYQNLSNLGKKIKEKEFLHSEEFYEIQNSINKVLKRPLVEQQVVGAAHIIAMERSLNFSVPGSGKTSTVLGAFEYLNSLPDYDKRHVDKLLVIGPVNCAKSWRDEYATVSFENEKHKPLNIIGIGDKYDKAQLFRHDYKTSRLIIINYESINNLKDELFELVDDKVLIVFDEIHRIKSTDSEKYKTLYQVIQKVKYRVALTGTPLPNGYRDLFNIISLLHDDYTADYFNVYISSLDKADLTFKQTGKQFESLNELLYPFYIRVTKKDLNVPLANPDHLIEVNVNNDELCLYKEIEKQTNKSFEKMIKLQEVALVPFKCSEENCDENKGTIDVNKIDLRKYKSSKMEAFLNVLKSNQRKCVVWCLFVDSINLVTRILNENGYKAKAIYGEIDQVERDRIIDAFNSSNEVEIIVTNPSTLAESVSLHKACHEAHYLELNYNLYHYLQSRDRIHRLGLKQSDQTNYFIYLNKYTENIDDSIDKRIFNALKKKEDKMMESIEKGYFDFEANSDINFARV